MCVAVLVPPGQRLTDEQIAAMHASNRDSWGFAFLQEYPSSLSNRPGGHVGFIRTVKGITNTADAISKYNSNINTHSAMLKYPHLAHFRITTAGNTDYNNAHPFVLDNGAMVHNGHLPGNIRGQHSDTAQFANAIRSVVKPGLSPEILSWMQDKIGYNKLIFLWRDGTAQIVNEEAGTRLPNGIWVSNTHWQFRLK